MAYTSQAAVERLVPMLGSFSTTSRVTSTALAGFIADVEAEIDVTLASIGYPAPYTDAGAFLTWLGKLATDGVAARAYKAWFMDTSGVDSQNQGRDLLKSYLDGLAGIRNRTMVPASIGEATASLPGGLTVTDAPVTLTMDQSF